MEIEIETRREWVTYLMDEVLDDDEDIFQIVIWQKGRTMAEVPHRKYGSTYNYAHNRISAVNGLLSVVPGA